MLNVLPVAPWLGAALLLVLVVAVNVPPPADRGTRHRSGGSPLARPQVAAPAVIALAALVLVARLGPDSVVDNPVPALVVGLAWPLLFALPPLLGLARRSAEPAETPRDVRPAVVPAAALVGYLALAPEPTSPRALAVGLACYALVLLAAGVALGGAVAARADAVGLVARWGALGRDLVRWHPPRGAAAVLAVLLAGTWAERAERTSRWFELAPGRPEQAALVLACLVAAGLAAVALTAWADGAAPVLVPLVAAAVVASVLRRALISAQLLWDQAGLGEAGVDPDPLGVPGGQAAALAVVVLGGAAASAVLARRVGPGAARLPGAAVVLAVTGVSGYLALSP